MDRALPWLLGLAGAFAIAGAVFDWDFFMENRKAALWVRLFGRNGARVFYVILGLVIIVLAIVVGVQGPKPK